MKTYKKTIDVPMLEIRHDEFAENPYMAFDQFSILIVGDNYQADNKPSRDLIKYIGERCETFGEMVDEVRYAVEFEESSAVVYISPVSKYEHSGVRYYLGEKKQGCWDSSFVGFVVVTKKSQEEAMIREEDIEAMVLHDLEMYNSWVNGEVYSAKLYDENGQYVETYGEIYGFENIVRVLPEEWDTEDLTKYLI